MVQFISRADAIADPVAARRKIMMKLRSLADLDDPESLVVPVLIDAILIAEAYRRARHEVTFLPELTKSVDALLRALTIAEEQGQTDNLRTVHCLCGERIRVERGRRCVERNGSLVRGEAVY